MEGDTLQERTERALQDAAQKLQEAIQKDRTRREGGMVVDDDTKHEQKNDSDTVALDQSTKATTLTAASTTTTPAAAGPDVDLDPDDVAAAWMAKYGGLGDGGLSGGGLGGGLSLASAAGGVASRDDGRDRLYETWARIINDKIDREADRVSRGLPANPWEEELKGKTPTPSPEGRKEKVVTRLLQVFQESLQDSSGG